MNDPFAEYYWKYEVKEMNTLEDMRACNVLKHENSMNTIDYNWAFKLKHFPDVSVNKCKACFCDIGEYKLNIVSCFKTYAPIVQCAAVRLVLILEVLLDLKSN